MTEMQKIPKRRIKKYNAKEFFEYVNDKNERYELIEGRIYMMASPNVNHQRIARKILKKLENYLEGKPCEPFMAPLDVVLFEKENEKDKSQNVYQPDLFVVCDQKKISDNRINGAPDFVIEVVSQSSETQDYFIKFQAYMKYGVREYWIVNPMTKQISVYINEKGRKECKHYTFSDKIPAGIFENFEIDFTEI